jgi:hypothetical protein
MNNNGVICRGNNRRDKWSEALPMNQREVVARSGARSEERRRWPGEEVGVDRVAILLDTICRQA